MATQNMTFIELQGKYIQTCYYYADNISPVDDVETFCLIEAVENKHPDAGGKDQPNYIQSITQWNHPSQQPTDLELMTFNVDTVEKYWQANVIQPSDIKQITYPSYTQEEIDKISTKTLSEGTNPIFNSSVKRLQILIENEWHEIVTKPILKGGL